MNTPGFNVVTCPILQKWKKLKNLNIVGYIVEACAEVKIHTRHRPVKIIELRPRPVPVKNVKSNSVPVPAPSHSTPFPPRTRIFQLHHRSIPVIMNLFYKFYIQYSSSFTMKIFIIYYNIRPLY